MLGACPRGAEVAVCIAGQLRSLERPHLQRVMGATWRRVGRSRHGRVLSDGDPAH